MRGRYLIPLIVLVLVFGFIPSCRIIEAFQDKETVEENIQEETTEEVEEEIVEESPEDDLSKEEFFESIKDDNLLSKAFDYSLLVYIIASDSIDTEKEIVVLTDDEIAARYLELASQIGKDSMGLGFIIPNNEQEKEIIDLMQLWFDKMSKSYEYLASYYWGDGALYEIKSDELQEEAEEIKDEWEEKMGEYRNE